MEQKKALEQPKSRSKPGADAESSGVRVQAVSVVLDIPTVAPSAAPAVPIADLVPGIPAGAMSGRGDAAGAVTEMHAFPVQKASASFSAGLGVEFLQQNGFPTERKPVTVAAGALVAQGKPMGNENSAARGAKGAANGVVIGIADPLAAAPHEEGQSKTDSKNDSNRGSPNQVSLQQDGLNQGDPNQAPSMGAERFEPAWLQALSRDRSAAGRDRIGAEEHGPVGVRGALGIKGEEMAGAGVLSLAHGTTPAGGARESTKAALERTRSGSGAEAGVKAGMTPGITVGVGTVGGAGEGRVSPELKGSRGKLESALVVTLGPAGEPGPAEGKTARAPEGGPQPDHSRGGGMVPRAQARTEQTHPERAGTVEATPDSGPQGPMAAKPIAQEAASQQPPSQELTGRQLSSKDLTGRDLFGKELIGKDLTRNDPTGTESAGKGTAGSPPADANLNEKRDHAGQGQGAAAAAGSRPAAGTEDLRPSADSFDAASVASVPVPAIVGAATHGDRGAASNLPGSHMPASNTPGPDSRIPQNILDGTPLLAGTRGEAGAILRQLNAAAPAEMRFNITTDAFGRVEMHTVVRDSQVGLALSSERGDLRGALRADLGQLDASLRQHDLRLQDLRFLDHPGDHRGHGAGLGNSGDGTDRGQDRSSGRGGHEQSRAVSTRHDSQSPRVEAEISAATEASALLYRKGGLSLRV